MGTIWIRVFVTLRLLVIARMESRIESIQLEIKAAFECHKTGLWEEAISKYEAVMPFVQGKMAETIASNAGAIHMQLGNYEAAVDKFQVAAEAAPQNAEPHFNKAVAHSMLKQHAKAIKHCKLAIQKDPHMHKAYHMMGNILQDIGKSEEAVRYFTMAENLAGTPTAETVPNSINTTDDSFRHLRVWNAKINDISHFLRLPTGEWKLLDSPSGTSDVPTTAVAGEDYLTLRCLSERPLIFEVPLLLTSVECEHIIATATPLLESSHVMGGGEARGQYAGEEKHQVISTEPFRSSFNAWLPRDDILSEMQRRIAALTGIPLSYLQLKSEDLQVVKYDSNGQFQLHQDSSHFHPRMVTALVYLQDATVPENGGDVGGDTWFPFAPGVADRECTVGSTAEAVTMLQGQADSGHSLDGLTITPRIGRAVIFFNHLRDGSIDYMAIHAGKKVFSGTKWVANYWVKHDPSFLNEINR